MLMSILDVQKHESPEKPLLLDGQAAERRAEVCVSVLAYCSNWTR